MLAILIPENKNTQPLLGLVWLYKLEIGQQGNKHTNIIRNINADERREKILDKSHDRRPDERHQIEKRYQVDPTKKSPVPIYFQSTVRRELENLIEKGHLEKADETTENCFVSPAVFTMKKDKSVKIALYFRKLNESCIKRKATRPNIKELISNFCATFTKNNREICMSKIDMDYAYG